MKFKIRYADQIVGFLSLIAIVVIIATIILIGSKQRWFAKDYHFYTDFETASGLSAGMAVQYKGFTIGKLESISLDKKDSRDTVRVKFKIFDTYYNWLHVGTVVDLNISPIGLGNQFLLYPGTGTMLLEDNSYIPLADSIEGTEFIKRGLVSVPKKDDTISNILTQANKIVTNIASVTKNIDEALSGKGDAPLTNTVHSVEFAAGNISIISGIIKSEILDITNNIESLTKALSEAANSPQGALPALVDPDDKIFPQLAEALEHTSGALENLEKATAVLPSQIPQISSLMSELKIALQDAEDVMNALKNNPLLKKGVPKRINTETTGTNPRDIDF